MRAKSLPSRFLSSIRRAGDLTRANQPQEALHVLAQTLNGADAFDPAHALYLQALLRLGLRREALEALMIVARLPRSSADDCDALAFLCRQLDRHEQAHALYRTAVDMAPDDPRHWFNLATSARSLGQLEEAAAACERALARNPGMLSALLLRSEIGTATATDNHVEELTLRLRTDRSDRAQMFVGYALGKELHELGRYDRAFEAFALGAAVRRRNLRYDVADDEGKMTRIRAAFRRIDGLARSSNLERRHVFIVGLPRSGTTLVERILSAAPGTRSNGETNNFSTALMNCIPSTGADLFQDSAAANPDAVAREYDRMAAFDGFCGTVIEKLPLNFLYVGAIARSLPDAQIVWVRRNALDSCFAMFRTLFGAGYPFSYDFEELARYYAAYERLMQHWNDVLPETLIAMDYDELVAEPTRVARRVVTRCHLPWSEDLVDITRNSTASLTASASQVRQPIHARSSGIWRSYAPWLEPLSGYLAKHRASG